MISRLARKRRARRANTQPDHPFTITSCEYLTDGAFSLLRVGGTGSVVPVALVTQGDGPEAFEPLPQPDAGVHDGKWQIAFALPTDVIEPGGRVWIHDGGLYLADLRIPAPAEVEPAEAEAEQEPQTQPEPVDDQHAKLVEALREELARLEQELAAMHNEGRETRRQVQQLEAELAERAERIEQLEHEAESFAARREEAVAESLRERIATLEEDLRQRDAANEQLRRQLAAQRLQPAAAPPAPRTAAKSQNGKPSPPWSALDDELLARIEKAKALTS